MKKRVLFSESVAAGFPSPAEGYMEAPLDLNEYLVMNPPATFFVRARGDSMHDAGIYTGDILVVDRSVEPASGAVVIAVLEGEFTVKYIFFRQDCIELRPANNAYKPVFINRESCDCTVWGVVLFAIHSLSAKSSRKPNSFR